MKHASLMLAILAFGHFVVDTIASTVNPIWPNLEDQLGMARGDFLAIGYLCWITTNSFAQILFGYLGDRVRCRWLIWFGPVVSIVCLALLGWIHSTWLMCLILFIAGLGIAAFHPEAAATAGSLLPHNRSRAMAIFALCGYLGQAVGPTYAGELVAYDGITTLAWHLVWALPAMLIVALGIQGRQFPLQSGSQTPPRIGTHDG
jgi:FSR family fosmidomycin resistance protein-like MFS transporter